MRTSLCLLILLTCGCATRPSAPFNPGALDSLVAVVDISRDTVLRAPGGSLIAIPAHALAVDSGATATIVVREALDVGAMIRAGLTTQSPEGPLSSGGMIYIGPANGQNVRITGKLTVRVPTPHLQSGMKLYKGVPNVKGGLDWVDPVPLAADSQRKAIERGRTLFMANCTSCHAVDKVVTGPALAYISERRSLPWIQVFIRNNKALLSFGDLLACHEFRTYSKISMNVFPTFTDADVDDVLHYIDNEADSLDLPRPPVDTCEARYPRMDSIPARLRELMRTVRMTPDTAPVQPEVVLPPLYYPFTITSDGWYNIDCLMADMNDVALSRLVVRLHGAATVNVYLVIPSIRLLSSGQALDGKDDTYGFYVNSGKTALPQGKKAYILAAGEQNGKPLFALSSFTTSLDQTIDLHVRASDTATINRTMRTLVKSPASPVLNSPIGCNCPQE